MAERSGAQRPAHADHFASLEQQVHAARLGMWLFLASEVLLFGALFSLYATYRAVFPDTVSFGVGHNARLLGSLNTLILLTSSFTVATSTVLQERGKRRLATLCLLLTLLLAGGFLVVKGTEYAQHYHEGIYVTGRGPFFTEHALPGLPIFFLLYYLMTGLHAVHVIIGMGVLTWLTLRLTRGRLEPPHEHPLHIGALYWHLVDLIWLFLWPLFYLTGGGH